MNTDNHLPKDNSSVPGRTNDPETFAKFSSVKSYQDYLTDKDNPVVMVTLTVNDQGFLDNTTFETYLTQHTNAHDEFTIVVSDTAIDDFYGQVMRNSKNLLGEPITIHIHHKGAVVQSFKGIIAQVSDKRNEGGGYGNLHISGYGLSILLDSGEECQSYEDKTLPEIIAEATNEYGDVKVNTKGMVNTKYKIPYVVQYKESDYQFIQRLARRYGEFFFYDGTQLQFNNETRQTVQLSEGDDLIEVAFELKIQPQHFSYLSYGVEKGEVEEKNTKNIRLQDKGNPFQFAAVKASEKVFTKKTKVPYNAFTEEFRGDYLADNVRREKESREQLMEVRGRSRNPNLRIGGFVKLKDINDKPMESYRIIDIKHHQSGYDYENEFVAIPDVYIAYYYDGEALPRTEQQIARVTDNNDPKGLGRVRVQFIWQVAKKLQTPWIRVVQPHAGGGKGFYFIPEIGEEVWVDFEDQNAERPFVVGSNYNGKEYSPFHNTNNDIKAIQTRSGHKLIFTEDESILLSDKNGNTLRFDTQGKNIEISAPESISLCAGKDLNLSAGNNLVMDVANTAFFNVLQQMLVTTPFMKQLIADYFHTQAGKALINSDNQIKIEARETNVAGLEKLFIHSDELATVNSKGLLEVKGERGTEHSNKAENYEVLESFSETNTIVYFRPKDTWKGEFGFDWLREQNGLITDKVDYRNMVGKYYKYSDEKMVKSIIPKNQEASSLKDFYIDDPNKWYRERFLGKTILNFKQDPQYETKNNKGDNTFEKLAQSFKHFNFAQKEITNQNGVEEDKYNIFSYYRSYIALFPATENYGTNTAEIDLHIKFLNGEKPDYLLFKIDNFDLTKCEHQNIGIDRVKIDNPRETETIKICCKNKENFTKDKNIKVYAVKKQSNGEITEHLAGCITMVVPIIKTLDVAVVSVKVDQLGGTPTPDWESFFKNILGQALIKVTSIIDTDATKNNERLNLDISSKKSIYDIDSRFMLKTDGLERDLETLFKNEHPNLYRRYFTLYFLDVASTDNGYSRINKHYGVMFNTHTKETITHECLHGLTLPHSFSYTEWTNYVYEAMATDNIMDYSHFVKDPVSGNARSPINRFQLWRWQWETIRKHYLLK
ncbi:type VI secretion system Vgr family protein [Capnocytophaga sp. oral taxon 336]|uniref:type VI secretion system Vgr family protein n=1 Tax=Capnocytophaga sp. oral taxon 336 TaxID=712216 RepID=UPI00034E11AC|nr:type VI secretion system Vgr family protein [Capnocytophaga sp. oral taxon 336]EPD99606.1 hypothetical protein HMPREF1528_01624 [Capnocytophaga sp. oral taxon 336 str. F0502]